MNRSSPYKYIGGIPRHFNLGLSSARDLLSMLALVLVAAIVSFVPESALSVDHHFRPFPKFNGVSGISGSAECRNRQASAKPVGNFCCFWSVDMRS